MSSLKNRHQRHDGYFKKARKEGYASRAVYKLEELDKRFRILKRGHRVLDLGCWPGSWMQYAAARVGPTGFVFGMDLKPVELSLPSWTDHDVGDISEVTLDWLSAKSKGPVQVVLSDLAPHTTGIRVTDVARSLFLVERVLDIAEALLDEDGAMVTKVFQGPGFDDLLARCKRLFRKTKAIRPKGSRPGSMEIYLVGLQRRPRNSDQTR